ncbi:MAG TPA: amidohydrolase family protein [bacterium]|nr:amidohydrolase family protein [bacterium]
MTAIDLHAHLVPPDVLARMAMLQTGPDGVAVRVRDRWQTVPRALVDPETAAAEADAEGIAIRVVSLPPFLLRHDLPPHEGLTYSRQMNDGLAALADRSAGRLRFLATVPLQSPAAAAGELRRAVEELGAAGAEIATNVAGAVELDDPGLEPFWEAAASLRTPILIHPHDVAGSDRMQAYHLRNLVGNPMETTLAAGRLLCGGVLQRHPDLRLVLAHGGGALPWLLGRLDRGFQVRAECRTGGEAPGQAARRFFYDTVVHSTRALQALTAWMGPSRVVLGTDHPFDMGDRQAVRLVTRAVDDATLRQAILSGNAQRLLGPARRPAHS